MDIPISDYGLTGNKGKVEVDVGYGRRIMMVCSFDASISVVVSTAVANLFAKPFYKSIRCVN